MRVAVLGGTGFVGRYIVDELLRQGHSVNLLIRPGSGHKAPESDNCALIAGDLDDAAALEQLVADSDAVIYSVGILREFPDQGISFQALHYEGVVRVALAAEQAGTKRFLLMSANGVKPKGTAYQRTKYAAEEHLRKLGLDWTVFRPSVIFGDPRGGMEFASHLKQEIIDSPLPAPLFYPGLIPWRSGEFMLSPVHVQDVAAAVVGVLDRDDASQRIFHLCGPSTLTWKDIIYILSEACGKSKLMFPAPALGLGIAASVMERFDWFPLTKDQLTMLMEGNSCDGREIFDLLGIKPIVFEVENLGYLKNPQ